VLRGLIRCAVVRVVDRRPSSRLGALAVILGAVVAASPAKTAAPVISSFSPALGTIGTSVTVTGSGFTGATAVMFNGAASRFTVRSDTKITAAVSAAASTGPISVTTPGGTGTSPATFTVSRGLALSPRTGPPTSRVRVSGAGFGAAEGVNIVFGTARLASATTSPGGNFGPISVSVPASALPGGIS